MEYNHFQHQDQTNSEVLHAQEYMHMNDIAFLLNPDLKKKKKERKKKKKKQIRSTDLPNFQAKRANKPFIFLGLTWVKAWLKVVLRSGACRRLPGGVSVPMTRYW